MSEPREIAETAAPAAAASADAPLLEVEDLKVHFAVRRGLLQRRVGTVRAVDGVSFAVRRGATLGLVGESGCGKSTTGRAILRLVEPTEGSVRLDGRELTARASAGSGRSGPRASRGMRRASTMLISQPTAARQNRTPLAR